MEEKRIRIEKNEIKAAGFCTDGPCFALFKAPIIIFGPGQSHICHKPNEYIDIVDIENATKFYKKIILNFLS